MRILVLIAFATQIAMSSPAIRVNNIKILPSPLKSVETSGEGNVTFNLYEANGEIVPATISGDINTEITIDLKKCKLKGEDTANIFGAILTYFDVTVSSGGKTLLFEQKADIPGDTFEPIRIVVEVTENALAPTSNKVGALVNIGATTGASGDGSSYVFTEAAPIIDAVNDAFTVDPGTNTTTVFVNDDADGTSPATNALLTDPTISNNGGLSGLTIDADGLFSVPANTEAGIYSVTYGICLEAYPSICDEANVSLTVTAGAIDAIDDINISIPGIGGIAILDITDNDTLNGERVILGTNVLISTVSNITPLVVNTVTGEVIVPSGTPGGIYTEIYTLCEVLNPTNCDDANITVTVNVLPDYTPKIRLTGATTSGPDTIVPAVLTVTEIHAGINTSDIIIRIPRHDYISFVYDSSMTSLGSKAVQNSDWVLIDHPAEYRFKYIGNNSFFTASSFSRIGLQIRVRPESGASGKIDFKMDIKPGNGDENAVNDSDSSQIDYTN